MTRVKKEMLQLQLSLMIFTLPNSIQYSAGQYKFFWMSKLAQENVKYLKSTVAAKDSSSVMENTQRKPSPLRK